MHDFMGDLRVAARRLRHSPGFVLVAVLSLTMAIAANLVVFGVTNAAILRPLNVADADRLWMVVQRSTAILSHSWPDYQDLRARNTTFADMAAFRISEAGAEHAGDGEEKLGLRSSGSYFDTLGVQPAAGRFFHSSDEHGPNSAPYVVLSDAFWRTRFARRSGVIGH